ncbi:hypothetical protein V6N13_069436 [Hibiscus sabdariffa]
MQWKGPWHSFARHGEVVNVYIVRKRSKGGKRFGFVRMNGKEDADRVIERLHGFKLYGSLLTVKHARNTHEHWGRFAGRDKEKGEETSCKEWGKYVNQRMKEDGTTREPGGSSNLIEVRQKRLTGHMEEEDLWKIRKCLAGEMITICSVSSISNRLLKWGLGEIKVQRMGAKLFLLTIEDEDLYLMLEDLDWSYLKEIFTDIKPWSETMSCRERATWLEVSGLPLHCWNGTTLKKIVGFSDDSDTTVGKKGEEVKVICEEVQESESISDSKSEQENKEVVGDDRSCSGTEALNVTCAKKTSINVDELMHGSGIGEY